MQHGLDIASIARRLRSDLSLAAVASLALTGVVAIMPFAVYRFLRGEWLIGSVDLLVGACLVLPLLHALVTGRNRLAFGVILVGGFVGCLAVAHLVGVAGSFWSFPFMVALFALLPVRIALLTGCSLAVLVLLASTGLHTLVDRLGYLVTAFLVCGLSAITAYHVGRQREALELAAATDVLTGIGNRRRMASELEQAARLACRSGSLPALMVLDLDHFKRINDECGHEAGDRVLVDFAAVVRSALRQTDCLYRMGGEEFLVLLPVIESPGIAVVAEKVRARVEAQLRSPLGPVTVSVGAALYRKGEPVSEWIARADAAVYQAKDRGRNGWSIAA